MNNTGKFLAALLAVFLLCGFLVEARAEAPQIMKLSDVKPGMKGYGLTVFKGTEPVKFNIEVITVLWNYLGPKRHIFLVRCTDVEKQDNNLDGRIDEYDLILKRGNVSSGMSGSPVYLKGADGKYLLVGAVAMTWSLLTEPIAGVTPIERMIEEMNTPVEKPQVRNGGLRNSGGAENETLKGSDPAAKYRTQMKPLSMPLSLSGFNRKAFDIIAKDLASRNIVAMQAGGGAGEGEGDLSKLKVVPKPGSAIGITLMKGDMGVFAYGTLTYVDGDKFIAFGHDMEGMGECLLPVSMGYVNTVMTTLTLSSKLASEANEVGYVTKDRLSGISGEFTDKRDRVRWVPAVFKIASKKTREAGKADYKVFKVEVIDDEYYLPWLLDYAFMSVIFDDALTRDEFAIWATTRIKFKGYDEIVLRDAYSGQGSVARYYYWDSPMSLISAIMSNPFKPVELESVEVTLDYSSELKAADIIEVKPDRERAKPGEEITLNLKLKTWRKDEWTEQIKVKLPEKIEGDHIILTVSGGTYAGDYYEYQRFGSVEDIITMLNDATRKNGIFVTTPVPATRIRYKGKYYEKLPPSIIEELRRTVPGEISTGTKKITLAEKETEWIADGYHRIVIKIDRKEKQK